MPGRSITIAGQLIGRPIWRLVVDDNNNLVWAAAAAAAADNNNNNSNEDEDMQREQTFPFPFLFQFPSNLPPSCSAPFRSADR